MILAKNKNNRMNLKELNIIKFPDGHKHLKDKFIWELNTIEASIKSFDDLFLIAQAKAINKNIKHLKINYLLGARCDRKFTDFEALDLKIIANFINGLNFESVCILKPHSDVSLALIDNSYSISKTSELFIKCVKEQNLSEYSIISPDAGASKWIEKELGRTDIIQCNKDRDITNGNIKSIKFSEIPNKNCIIVDDLCDGGRTFTTLAKELRQQGAEKVFLVITHGMFSQGFEVFDGLIDHIYCTNSFDTFSNSVLTQISV